MLRYIVIFFLFIISDYEMATTYDRPKSSRDPEQGFYDENSGSK